MCAPALSEKKVQKKFRLRRQKKKSKNFSPAVVGNKETCGLDEDLEGTWKGLGHGQEGGGGKQRNLWTGRGLGRDLDMDRRGGGGEHFLKL